MSNHYWRRLQDWTLRPAYPSVAALAFFLLAAAVAVFPIELHDATRSLLADWIALHPALPELWLVGFWSLFAALAVTVVLRLRAEGWENTERVRKVLQTVHLSPNPTIFANYPRLYREAEAAERGADAALEAIHAVLNAIIELTRYFSRTPGGSIRARVFLIARPGEEASAAYPPELVERLRFFDRSRLRLDSLGALLYLPAELSVGPKEKGKHGEIVLALPVPRRAETPHGHRLALPGPPHVLLSGEPCVCENTRILLGAWCEDLEKAVRDELERYYGMGGEGRDTRSFISMRLGGDDDPTGVLNLECDQPDILGPEPSYYVTYFALVTPLVRLLIDPLARLHPKDDGPAADETVEVAAGAGQSASIAEDWIEVPQVIAE